jgi:hypothetical protein
VKKCLLILAVFTGLFANAQQSSSASQQLDSRANRYYSANDIAQMDALKIAQLNFIFQHSWVINTNKPCPECPTIDSNAFDVYQYAREAKSRKRVYLSVPGNPIDILSYQELDIEMERIKNEMITNTNQH